MYYAAGSSCNIDTFLKILQRVTNKYVNLEAKNVLKREAGKLTSSSDVKRVHKYVKPYSIFPFLN